MYTQQIYAWTALTGYEFPYLAALSRSHARVCIKTSLSLCLNAPLYAYAYTPMPPYTPCLYAPSVEHKLTGRLASGVQSGALVGKIMLSPPSNYHLDTLLHSFLSVLVAKADQLMRQKIFNSSPGSFNNGSSSYYLWPP